MGGWVVWRKERERGMVWGASMGGVVFWGICVVGEVEGGMGG